MSTNIVKKHRQLTFLCKHDIINLVVNTSFTPIRVDQTRCVKFQMRGEVSFSRITTTDTI